MDQNMHSRKRARIDSTEPSNAATKPRLDSGKPDANGLPSASVARAEIRAVLDLWQKVHLSADGEHDVAELLRDTQKLTKHSVAGRNALVNCLEGFSQQVRPKICMYPPCSTPMRACCSPRQQALPRYRSRLAMQ